MALEVIGAGFGRTGTGTLKLALERLGFAPCYHMSECGANADTHVPFWAAAYRGEAVDWDAFFSTYRATTDEPACDLYEVLAEHYPSAKVILTVRDPEQWYESVATTIYPACKQMESGEPDPWLEMVNEFLWGGRYGGRFEDEAAALEVYRRHVEEVQSVIPRERLLVYDVREGWEPLCGFLGARIPDEAFPHEHERRAFIARLRQRGVRV